MIIQFLIFFSLMITVFGGMHWLFYILFSKFFALTIAAKTRFMILLIILGANFIISMILARRWDNIWSQSAYLAGSVWLGLLLNLLMIMGAGFVLMWLLGAFGVEIRMIMAGSILVALAILFSGYGIWNAFYPRVVRTNVTLDNLGANWKGKKIVQISDVHLGLIHHRGWFEGVVDMINAEKPDLLLITGDLFDGEGDNLKNLVQPLNRIECPIYFVTGNHETYLGENNALAALNTVPVIVLDDQIVNLNGLQIVGATFPSRISGNKDFSPLLSQLDRNIASIFMFHQPSDIQIAKKFNIGLQLAGHTHAGQLFPLRIFTWLIFKGHDYGMYRDGSYHLYTTSGVGTWGPPMRTGNNPEIVSITLQ